MLRWLRKSRNMQIAIVGFLAALFGVWGVGGVLSSRQQPRDAGALFGRAVSWTTYARAWELTRENLREIYRIDLPKELIDAQTWTRLLLLAEAKRRRLEIDDRDVVNRIQSISLFHTNGVFDRQLYEAFLRFRRTAPRAFEESIREDLAIARLQAGVLHEVHVSEQEIQTAYRRAFAQARVAYLLIDPAGFTEAAQRDATPELIHAYYTSHSQEFRLGAGVNLDYVAFRLNEAPTPTVKDEDVQAYYTTHQQQLVPAEPGASTPPPPSPAPAVRQRVLQILQTQQRQDAFDALATKVDARLRGGKSLEAIAREFGRPLQSTGFFSREQPIPTIGQAPEVTAQAFRLSLQDRPTWVETAKDGYVIRVKEQRAARLPSFQEIEAQVRERLVRERARARANARAAETAVTCRQRLAQGETLDAVARSLGDVVQRPDPFTRTGYIAGLGVQPAFAEAAFALAPGAVSDAVELPTGYAIIQLMDVLPIDQARYAKERVTFAETVIRQQQEAHFDAWLKDLKARARLVSYLKPDQP